MTFSAIPIIIVGWFLIWTLACWKSAIARGRNGWLWGLLGFVFGFVALIVLLVMGPLGAWEQDEIS